MTKYSKNKNSVSQETKNEALKIALGTQKPGQTKEQTKLIAQGIQKGIEQYKKQHKAKSRELNKELRKIKNSKQKEVVFEETEIIQPTTSTLPWSLLAISWAFFAALFVLYFV